MAKTAAQRVKKQRESRAAEGWELVSVWVPTAEDAQAIKAMAEGYRRRAEALDGLSDEVKTVTHETQLRIAEAIGQIGSDAYTREDGAVLDLMTKLADEDDLLGFSQAFVLLARARPLNAHLAAAAVPAKVTHHLIRRRGIDTRTLLKWTRENPHWADRLKGAVRQPDHFVRVVDDMILEIKSSSAHAPE